MAVSGEVDHTRSAQPPMSELEHMSNLYCGTVKRLKCLSYLPRILADKDYEAQRIKEKLVEYENRYHQVYSNYTDLLRTISTSSLCPGCGKNSDVLPLSTEDYDNNSWQRTTNKLFNDGDYQSNKNNLQKQLFNIPEVSKVNFDRLVDENVKLKKAIMEIKDKGFDVERVMAVQEYENIIGGLREYTLRLKLDLEEVKYMNSILMKKDRNSMAQKCQQLQKQVSLLSKGVNARDEIIAELMKVIKKNKDGVQLGEEQGFMASNTSESGKEEDLTFVKDEEDTRQKILDYENKISKLEQQVAELKVSLTKEREIKAILVNHKDLLASHDASLVDREQYPESIYQFLHEKKSLQDAVNVLHHDLKKALDDNKLLVEQCNMYHHDFYQEKKKNKMEKEQLQAEIKKLKKENKSLLESSLSSQNGFDSGYGSSVASCPSRVLNCERCEQTFNECELAKYQEHVKKCLDD